MSLSFIHTPAARTALALALPFAVTVIQWIFWDAIRPFAWFLYFPTVFASAWLANVRTGIIATLCSALLAKFFFMPPLFSLIITGPMQLINLAMFVMMGTLFSIFNERLRQANRKTMEALEETRAANEKITQLYQKTLELDELKSRFFANVSHELRTPLTLIMGPVEHLLQELQLQDGQRQQLLVIERNARLLYRHVCDLLDVAKLESGRMSISYARLDLTELTRAMASHFDSVARERGIDYRVDTSEPLSVVMDGEKVQRILLNLLSNAFNFTPDGGYIAVRLAAQDDEAVIEIQDNGPGVPTDLHEAVFERFRQVEGGARRRHGGTGLGLAIVKEFAQLHGGSVRVSQAPGGGALFTVCLPLAVPAGVPIEGDGSQINPLIERGIVEELSQNSDATRAPALLTGADTPLVLVIDDNADMRAFISEALRPFYQVACANDGQEGLEKANILHPDLVLCDVMMPIMSGDEMVTELRRHPEMADLPIIMLTAKADDALRVDLLKAGVQGYINKPFSVDELLARAGGLISARRRTTERLEASETRFEATFEQAAVGIALVAPDGRWLRVNRKLCAIVGYGPEELLTKTFQEITHPDDLDTDLDYVHRVLAHEIDTYSREKRYIRKDGSSVWINLTVALVWKPDHTPDYFISVIEDIQARKDVEAEMFTGKARLEAALASMSDAVFISDTEGHFIHVNDAFATFHKFGNKAECSRTLAEYPQLLDVFMADGEPAPLEQWAVPRALRGETATNAEYSLRRKDTGETWVGSYSFAPVHDKEGLIVGSVVTARDVTEQKHAHELLIQAKEVAEAANRAKTEFLAIISHELRTPLNGIFGGSQLLQMTTLDQEQQESLDMITVSAANELTLVNDLLDLAQIEAGGLTVVAREFSLRQCLEDTASIQKLQTQKRGLALLENIAPDLPEKLLGDPLRLRQILLNLLGNAIKFTEKGSITLQARLAGEDEHGRVLVCFSVADTGIGIADEDLKRIFKPFEQVDMSHSRRYGGVGLGLTICRRLAEMLSGRIWAESNLGHGSIFHLELPFARVGSKQSEAVAEPDCRSHSLNILLVDDDSYSLKAGAALLDKLGHQITTAGNGREALDEWQKKPFDLIMMDIQMPVMTGMEALDAIRSLESSRGGKRTPIIAQTAYAMSADREKLLAEGFDGYISKPLLVAQLKQELARVCSDQD